LVPRSSQAVLSVVVNETMNPLSEFEIPADLLWSEGQMIKIVFVLSVKRTLRIKRTVYESIYFRLFFLADVRDASVDCLPERNEGIAVFY
jgi:hypothetical protein